MSPDEKANPLETAQGRRRLLGADDDAGQVGVLVYCLPASLRGQLVECVTQLALLVTAGTLGEKSGATLARFGAGLGSLARTVRG